MDSILNMKELAGIAGVMLVGASIPSTSVLVVSARSVSLGLRHGVLTALGIVAGDVFFILVAIYGLALLADTLGTQFVWIKYLGAAYLIWLGLMLWRSSPGHDEGKVDHGASAMASFMTGLLITLGDQKAILFYLGFLPAFVDLATISVAQTAAILLVAVVAVGAPKLVYAVLADRAGRSFQVSRLAGMLHRLAGGVMIGVGVFLLVTA